MWLQKMQRAGIDLGERGLQKRFLTAVAKVAA